MPIFIRWMMQQPRPADFPTNLPDFVTEEELKAANPTPLRWAKARPR